MATEHTRPANVHTRSVNIYEAKTGFSRLISDVESGDEVTISRNGRPVAMLVPYQPTRPARRPGALRGEVSIASDFDDFSGKDDEDWYGR